MTTPEHEYYVSLPSEKQDRLKKIISTYRGLGLAGCGICKMPGWVRPIVDGKQDDLRVFVSLDRLPHYAIELNGMKRPSDQGRIPCSRHNDFDSQAVAGILAQIGVDPGNLNEAVSDFQDCSKCDKALTVTGSTPGFDEAVTVLETEFGES